MPKPSRLSIDCFFTLATRAAPHLRAARPRREDAPTAVMAAPIRDILALLRRHWAWWLVPMLLVLGLGLVLLALPAPDAAPPFRY